MRMGVYATNIRISAKRNTQNAAMLPSNAAGEVCTLHSSRCRMGSLMLKRFLRKNFLSFCFSFISSLRYSRTKIAKNG